jgi:hypothetical protein
MKAGESRNLIVLGLALCLFSCPAWGLVLFDTDYEFETYATFDPNCEGTFHDMVFGPDVNLYVTCSITIWGRDGVVYKVSPDGDITIFAADLVRPTDIIWAGGTDYGDYFYVCDPYEREAYKKGIVVQIAPDGTTSTFAGPYLNDPVSLEIDCTGIYRDLMYVGSSSGDRINTVSTTGDTELFYSIGSYIGSPRDIAFDENGQYDWLMYVAEAYPDKPDISGILMFDPEGNLLGRYVPELVGAYEVEFDEVGTMFDGDMYVRGFSDWEGSEQIWRVQPDGSCEQFCRGKYKIFTFGPDGAMYVLERVDGVATIQRVYRVSLSGGIVRDIKSVIAQKQEAIDKIAALLAKEQETCDKLAEMLECGDYGDFTKQDIAKAIRKLEFSIAEQEKAICELEDSIFWLEKVLTFLGVEPE